MKKSDLQRIIKEEIQKILQEEEKMSPEEEWRSMTPERRIKFLWNVHHVVNAYDYKDKSWEEVKKELNLK